MNITEIRAPRGANRRKKYLGRGKSSGHGKTSTRGNKGQGSRAGRDFRPGFEGGSMTLMRRLPKRGFRSYPSQEYQIINIGQLSRFSKGTTVTPLSLKEEGLIRDENGPVKLLGDGKFDKVLTVKVHRASESAKKKLEEVKATLELIELSH